MDILIKQIVLCVDQTPSMGYKEKSKSIMECVNEGVKAFAEKIKREKNENESYRFYSVEFSNECTNKRAAFFSVDTFFDEIAGISYSVTENGGKANAVMAISKAMQCLDLSAKGYIVFVSDGLLNPEESQTDMKTEIQKIKDSPNVKGYAVGFRTERSKDLSDDVIINLEDILDYYTGRSLFSVVDSESYTKQFESVAKRILEDQVMSSDDKGKHD